MSNSVYHINKGINAPMEFHGLKAQYIWYLGGGLVGLLLLFASLYIAGVNSLICVAVALAGGSVLFVYVYRLNNKYGQYGMMRRRAAASVPTVIRSYSRKILCTSKVKSDGKITGKSAAGDGRTRLHTKQQG